MFFLEYRIAKSIKIFYDAWDEEKSHEEREKNTELSMQSTSRRALPSLNKQVFH